MKLRVYVVSGQSVAHLYDSEDVVKVSHETAIPLRMLNDMIATTEGDGRAVTAIERGLLWDD